MEKSEQIDQLAMALVKAQAANDSFAEAGLINKLHRLHFKRSYLYNRFNHKTLTQRFFERIAYGVSDCWYWVGSLHHYGYGAFSALGENRAHRVSYRLFKGEIPHGLQVLHKCDVPGCVNPDHLFLGTIADNVKDMEAKGRRRSSIRYKEENPNSKLTMELAAEMKEMSAKYKISIKELAIIYEVSPIAVWRTLNNRVWI